MKKLILIVIFLVGVSSITFAQTMEKSYADSLYKDSALSKSKKQTSVDFVYKPNISIETKDSISKPNLKRFGFEKITYDSNFLKKYDQAGTRLMNMLTNAAAGVSQQKVIMNNATGIDMYNNYPRRLTSAISKQTFDITGTYLPDTLIFAGYFYEDILFFTRDSFLYCQVFKKVQPDFRIFYFPTRRLETLDPDPVLEPGFYRLRFHNYPSNKSILFILKSEE